MTFVVSHLVRIERFVFFDEKVILYDPVPGGTVELVGNPRNRVFNILGGVIYRSLEVNMSDEYFSDNLTFIRHEDGFTFNSGHRIRLPFTGNGFHYPFSELAVLDIFNDALSVGSVALCRGSICLLLPAERRWPQAEAGEIENQQKRSHVGLLLPNVIGLMPGTAARTRKPSLPEAI